LLKDIADFTTDEGHGTLNVWMSRRQGHGIAPGFKLTSPKAARSPGWPTNRHFYAVQFHPKSRTQQGKACSSLRAQVCGARPGGSCAITSRKPLKPSATGG
jgi:GMP synthase (glutamine-hydrolysing)